MDVPFQEMLRVGLLNSSYAWILRGIQSSQVYGPLAVDLITCFGQVQPRPLQTITLSIAVFI